MKSPFILGLGVQQPEAAGYDLPAGLWRGRCEGKGEKRVKLPKGVFHFENGQIFSWNSDAAEGSCFDYPLSNGTMVRQSEFNGTRSYQLFQYKESGREEPATLLFAREELIPEDSSEPCPYYAIDGKEVDETEFDRQFALLVDGPLVERTAWTPLK